MTKSIITTTTIHKDGTTTTTTATRKRKKSPPPIYGEAYDDYSQGVHLICANIHNLCSSMKATIEAFNKFYPLGEAHTQLEAVCKVLANTTCFANRLRDWVIHKSSTIPAENSIDF